MRKFYGLNELLTEVGDILSALASSLTCHGRGQTKDTGTELEIEITRRHCILTLCIEDLLLLSPWVSS
ncbi:hypothetical protein NIES4101_33640 [Calothrix sp. NIES-4101]|nr:hypothetical protein NIES4101_33640 [Calothrix sp. NIES-4101]